MARTLTLLLLLSFSLFGQLPANSTNSGGTSNGTSGTGTANTVTKFTGTSTLGNSSITDNGTTIGLGINTSIGGNALTQTYTNANPGTVTSSLAKINSSRNAVKTAVTDTTNIFGICVSGCGNSGSSEIAFSGRGLCTFDNQTVGNDFVVGSTSVAGDCSDAGSTEPFGIQVIGRVLTVNSGVGTTATVDLYTPDVVNSSPAIKTLTIANAGSTGTTLNKLAKLTGAPSTVVVSAITDTQGAIGIVSAGAGTTGSATIVQNGTANCVFDGATVAGDYAQISTSAAGDCHDAGAIYPTSGEIIGRVTTTNVGTGTYLIVLGSPDVNSPTAGTSHSVTFNIDGQGSAITTGALGQFPGVVAAGTITSVQVSSDASGSITVDIWKKAGAIPSSADKISASAPATLSSAQLNQASSTSGWTKTIAVGDVFGGTIVTSATVKKATVQIFYQ